MDNKHKCKHYGEYGVFSPVETTPSEAINKLKNDDNLKSFLMGCQYEGSLSYHELSDENKMVADDMWEGHKLICEECSLMRCSEHCGQRNEGSAIGFLA